MGTVLIEGQREIMSEVEKTITNPAQLQVKNLPFY